MTILFVANHPRFASITVKTFLSAHTVMVVPSMATTREALADNNFNVVLVDYDLDDGKGAELVWEIQTISSHPVIIAVSSHEAGNQALMQSGADAVCSKMNFKNIESIIAEATAHRR